MTIYIGSYTPEAGGEGTGISVWDARLRPAAPSLACAAPSWLVAHPQAPVLYAVSELDDGAVNALAIAADGSLRPLSRQPSGGSAPCHLSVTGDGRYLLCANYGSGSVAVFGLADDGALDARTDLVSHHGGGPDPARQEGPHTHEVVADGGEVVAVDLGTDTLYGYRLTPDGALTPTWRTHAGPGIGPRHLVSAPTGLRYVSDELASTVSIYEPAPGGGLRLVHRQPATLTEPTGPNQPSELALSADGRFLYVANRGNDTVVTFAVDGAALTGVAETPTGGHWPRHFVIDGDLMYVANQKSDDVTVLRVDPSSGVPHPTGDRIDVPDPVCVLIRRA
ncbi:lactonase family protein [Planosporangium thailandense]|uniref:Lactonase family protein n=1 Tax=Planosporangium thailandense TaxID=765197 RepID=A0ABX0Y9U5_9ACTN|nr:lactonase family protein [Planosporangium thailandense]NJC74014.1 lactonase family protein [Planosporangium thailandense]